MDIHDLALNHAYELWKAVQPMRRHTVPAGVGEKPFTESRPLALKANLEQDAQEDCIHFAVRDSEHGFSLLVMADIPPKIWNAAGDRTFFTLSVRGLAAGDLLDAFPLLDIVNVRMAFICDDARCQIKTDKRPL